MLSDEQRHAIESLYDSEQELSLKYFPANTESQNEAQRFLAANQLDSIAREKLENRWNIQWSRAAERHANELCFNGAPATVFNFFGEYQFNFQTVHLATTVKHAKPLN